MNKKFIALLFLLSAIPGCGWGSRYKCNNCPATCAQPAQPQCWEEPAKQCWEEPAQPCVSGPQATCYEEYPNQYGTEAQYAGEEVYEDDMTRAEEYANEYPDYAEYADVESEESMEYPEYSEMEESDIDVLED